MQSPKGREEENVSIERPHHVCPPGLSLAHLSLLAVDHERRICGRSTSIERFAAILSARQLQRQSEGQGQLRPRCHDEQSVDQFGAMPIW